jgi:hypothetical protein
LLPIGFPAASSSERIRRSRLGGNIERQHVDLAEQVFDSFEQRFRTGFRANKSLLLESLFPWERVQTSYSSRAVADLMLQFSVPK